jgi:hypothetical protein
LILICLALAACGPYPDDISGTLDRIEQKGEVRVGLTEIRPVDDAAVRRFVERIEQASGAEASIDSGPQERQLARLEDGELDLVIGEFASDTPWLQSMAIIEPLSSRRVGKRTIELAPVVRPGENRWAALVEREVRNSRGQHR